MKILIAGVGNLLRGDDGFGVRVVQRLAERPLPEGIRVVETGVRGLSLVHELMEGYDACIIADAADHGGKPGSLHLFEPEWPRPGAVHSQPIDPHQVDPSQALILASAVGVAPMKVYVVACQPAEIREFTDGLTPPVEQAVDEAIRMVERLLGQIMKNG